MKKFTEDEKVIARNTDKDYKWIARNKSGYLAVFAQKPYKDPTADYWNSCHPTRDLYVFNHVFKAITWEDKEPTLIKDIYDPQILDDAERRYLEGVIRPWKNRVVAIRKAQYIHVVEKESVECIAITTIGRNNFTNENRLPYFKAGTMYEGMEPGREYTLKELGLFEGVQNDDGCNHYGDCCVVCDDPLHRRQDDRRAGRLYLILTRAS